jgi:hypothetical protein
MKPIVVLIALASAAMAGEVTYPVPKKDALRVEKPFDRMSREQISVTANVTARSVDSGDSTGKTLDVSIAGNNIGGIAVECLYVVEAVPGTREAGTQRILVAGQGYTAEPRDNFQFRVGTLNQSTKLKGWFVRVVRDGAIIGVAGSSPKFEAMAADPKTAVLYGQK